MPDNLPLPFDDALPDVTTLTDAANSSMKRGNMKRNRMKRSNRAATKAQGCVTF